MLELGHVVFGRGLLQERPGQHEFGLEHGAGPPNGSVKRRRHPLDHRVLDLLLNVRESVAAIALIPVPIERSPEPGRASPQNCWRWFYHSILQ
jgi:hypothetical protein